MNFTIAAHNQRARVLLIPLLFLASASQFKGQTLPRDSAEAATASESVWKRFTGKDEEFSVLMPGTPSLYLGSITTGPSRITSERIYSSYSQGSVYLIVSYNSGSIKGTLENFKAHHLRQADITFARDVTLAGHSGKEYRVKFGEVAGTLQIYTTKQHGYAVAIIQSIDDPPLREYFLSSFLIKCQNEKIVSAETQPPPPRQDIANNNSGQSLVSSKDVTRRVIVVSKPEPWYSEDARRTGVSGTVVLRAVLSSSGQVTNIEAFQRLSKGLTETAIDAARHLKFIPAVKDGRFVSIAVELQYNFGLY